MKKLIALLLVLVTLFSFAGCISQADLDAAKQESYDKGYSDGHEIGYDAGEDAGYSYGYEEGYNKGYDDGEAKASATSSASTKKDYTPDYSSSASDEMVYVSRTGSKYHSSKYCSNMSDPEYMSIEAAKALGRTACKNCY